MNKVQGIGIYEKGKFPAKVDGKDTKVYNLWGKVLARCNPTGYHQKRRPSYIGCSVHPDWVRFQDFAEWHSQQLFEPGYQLDKDLLVPGNKIYAPDTCVFLPLALNSILLDNHSTRGDLPLGVKASGKKFAASLSIDARKKYLGLFDTPEDAHKAYRLAKAAEIKRKVPMYRLDPKAVHGFDTLVEKLEDMNREIK